VPLPPHRRALGLACATPRCNTQRAKEGAKPSHLTASTSAHTHTPSPYTVSMKVWFCSIWAVHSALPPFRDVYKAVGIRAVAEGSSSAA